MEVLNALMQLVPSPLVAVGCVVILAVAWVTTRLVLPPYRQTQFYRRQGIPGHPFRPLVGNLPEFKKSMEQPFSAENHIFRPLGPVDYHSLGPSFRICIHDPELAQEVLVTKQSSFGRTAFSKRLVKPLMGRGVVLLDGPEHARQRRHMGPAFHFQHLKGMTQSMVDNVTATVTAWLNKQPAARAPASASQPTTDSVALGPDEILLDMHKEASALALRIATRAVFGTDLPPDTSPSDMYENLQTVFGDFERQLKGGISIIFPWYSHVPTKTNRKVKKSLATLNSLLARIIRLRREALLATKKDDPPPRDLLGMLMLATTEDGRPAMTDTQLRDEAMTFLVAAHETTAGLVSWTLVMLGKHPEWAARLHGEVDSVLGDRAPAYEDLERLPLVNAVLLETLRVLPPIPVIVRVAIKDVTIGKYFVRKGTNVTLGLYSIQRNRRVWDRPQEWLPERFEGGMRKAMKHPMALLAFSAGKSNCIGQRMALQESRIILAMILQRLDLRLLPSYVHHPERSVTLRPKFGVPMALRPRSSSGRP